MPEGARHQLGLKEFGFMVNVKLKMIQICFPRGKGNTILEHTIKKGKSRK